MSSISFDDLVGRLTPEALALFEEMVSAHLKSAGDRLFIRADSMGGNHMIFTGEGPTRSFSGFDGGAIEDLLSWRLLHLGFGGRGSPNYRVSGKAIRFYRWLMDRRGSPVDQVQHEVRRIVEAGKFAEAHPSGSHHLREAFDLLWSGRTDAPAVSEIGDHLRKALMDVTSDVAGTTPGGGQERPVERLRQHLEDLSIPDRERNVLQQVVELVRVVLRLDHRLNHVRDEADAGEPEVTWEEARRTAFATAFACHELGRLSRR